MSDILVIFDKHRKSQETNLMMQQAIVAVTRSILANRNTNQHGMTMSHHRIIVPINLDILPLYQLDIINRHNQTTYYLGSKPLSILTFAHELKIKATTFCAVF